MTYNPKIVSIGKDGAYLYNRAMKNLKENNIIDALELLRAAVEKEPETVKYRIELAGLLNRTGYCSASQRILLDILAEDDVEDCYFTLALNRLFEKNRDGAKRALNILRNKTGQKDYDAQIDSIDDALMDDILSDFPDEDRHRERERRCVMRALAALKSGEPEKAVRIFEGRRNRGKLTDSDTVYYALALKQSRRETDISRMIEDIDENEIRELDCLCVLVQLLEACGMKERVGRLLDGMLSSEASDNETTLLILTLLGADRIDDAEKIALRMLHDHPYNKYLLHMNAVIAVRKGTDDVLAASYWNTILRIDPEDSVAHYYISCLKEDTLDRYSLPLSYELPAEESIRRLNSISASFGEGMDHVVSQWKEDDEFRRNVIWATGLDQSECVKAAAMILVSADDELSRSIIREMIDRQNIDGEVRVHILNLIRGYHKEYAHFIPRDMLLGEGLYTGANTVFKTLPAYSRQLIRYAADVLSEDFKTEAMDALTMRWSLHSELTKNSPCVLVSSQEASAALTWNYLLERNIHVRPQKLVGSFECRPRRMLYYARHMASVFDRVYEEHKNESH